MPSHAKKFPFYLKQSFGTEESLIELADKRENYLLNSLFRIEQSMDQYLAYKYAEDNWLTRDITTLTAADIIILVKEINRIAGRTLVAAKNENGAAGEYLRHSINMTVPTGIPDTTFEDHLTFSPYNYYILCETHNKQTAELYKEFSLLLELEFRPSNDLVAEKALREWATIVESHSHTPAGKAYALVKRVINPAAIPKQMDIFSSLLVANIAAKKDPITLAAFILAQLPTIHPFPHANSRSARIFMNTVLMMANHEPIHIPVARVDDYYLCLKQYRDGDIKPLKALLTESSQPHADTTFFLTDHYFPTTTLFDNSLEIICHETEYNFVLPAVVEDHHPTGNDLLINAEFYLQHALKYIESDVKAANFYYTAASRLANNENLNPELATRIQANMTPLSIHTPPNRKYKPLYVIAPHETARMSANRNQQEGLVAYIVPRRYAVVIMDNQKNISMTIIDRPDRLDFMEKEVAALKAKPGEFTIDVIKIADDTSPATLKDLQIIQQYIHTAFGNAVKNSKGNHEVRNSKTGGLMIAASKLQTPAKDDIQKRVAYNVFNIRYTSRDPAAIVLKDWVVYEGGKIFQARLTERMLVTQVVTGRNDAPQTVVFDEEWTGHYPEPPKEVSNLLNATLGHPLPAVLAEVTKFLDPGRRVAGWINEVAQQVMRLNSISTKSLSFHLHSFFNKTNAPAMPQNAISHIKAYAESEELGGFRQINSMGS
jgi:hypothetical protein